MLKGKDEWNSMENAVSSGDGCLTDFIIITLHYIPTAPLSIISSFVSEMNRKVNMDLKSRLLFDNDRQMFYTSEYKQDKSVSCISKCYVLAQMIWVNFWSGLHVQVSLRLELFLVSGVTFGLNAFVF